MIHVILDIVRWYLVLTGIGVIGFPIVFRFLKKLPGRGFVYSRSLGLVLISYFYWLFGSLGFLRNSIGSLLPVIILLSGVSVFLWIRQKNEIREWIKNALRYLIVSELVFLLGFILVITIRLAGPEVSGTEKPMEMMFINSILKSDTFPPHDGWLSGYSISYYYFGYIMVAVLVMLSGVSSSVGTKVGIIFYFIGILGIEHQHVQTKCGETIDMFFDGGNTQNCVSGHIKHRTAGGKMTRLMNVKAILAFLHSTAEKEITAGNSGGFRGFNQSMVVFQLNMQVFPFPHFYGEGELNTGDGSNAVLTI